MASISAAVAARWANFLLRILQFCASAIILGVFAYFLAALGDHDLPIEPWHIAVTAISGAAMAYSAVAIPFSLFWGGKSFFSVIGMGLDFVFGAGMVAIAIMDRGGTQSCSGRVDTPLGIGNADGNAAGFGDGGFGVGDGQKFTYMVDLKLACRLQKATFAVSIIGIFLYFVSIAVQHIHSKYAKRPTFDRQYVRDPLKRSWWPFGKRQSRSDAPLDTRDADGEAASIGSIPLSDRPTATDKELEDNPPRYTRIFGWGKRNSTAKAETEAAKVKSVDSNYSASGYGNDYYATNTHQGTGWDNYTFGSSGAADNGYSYGYGYGGHH